jgi:hypothetical protein
MGGMEEEEGENRRRVMALSPLAVRGRRSERGLYKAPSSL